MSKPRPIFPNTTYLITRNCSERRFFLKPDGFVKNLIGYCLALAQRDTRMALHVVAMNINHYHLEATDIEGSLPQFSYIFHKYAAKCLNAHYGRSENLWRANQKTNYVELGDEAAVLDKAVYAITNVVKDGQVARSEYWEGLLLWTPGSYTFHKPPVFFDADGDMPETIHLRISAPPHVDRSGHRQYLQDLRRAVKETESQVRSTFADEGRRFRGVAALRKLHHEESPPTPKPPSKLIPRVACSCLELRQRLLQRLQAFEDDYEEARSRWITGSWDTVFPYGTYKLRREFQVACDSPPFATPAPG